MSILIISLINLYQSGFHFFIIIIFGIFFQYVALGGDSFNGSRHFQILTPLLIGFSAITVNFFGKKLIYQFAQKMFLINIFCQF